MITSLMQLSKREKIFLSLLPLLLTFILGIFGSDVADQGFVRGFSWRILNGEIPYRDFIYPRPPLTIYLDWFFKLLSPDFIEVFLERLRFYFQMMVIVLLVISRIDYIKIEHYFKFIIISYLLTLDTMAPTSWYTTDGILFGALSFFFFHVNGKHFGWCLFFAFCSALTKQSFYPVPIFIIGYGLLNIGSTNWKQWALGILPVLFLIIGLLFTGTINGFVSQTTGMTKAKDLYASGFRVYFSTRTFRSIIYLIVAYFLYKKNRYLGVIGFLVIASYDYGRFIYYSFNTYICTPITDWPRVMLMTAGLFTLTLFKQKEKFYTFTFLLIIAWSSSLSWGYKTPAMFSVGLLVMNYFLLLKLNNSILSSRSINGFLYAVVFIFLVQNIDRYMQGRIWTNTFHLGSLNSKYNLIFTNAETFNLYRSAKKLNIKEKSSFLPDFSDGSYFLNQNSSHPLDWFSDLEIQSQGDRVLNTLLSCPNPIYLIKKPLSESMYATITKFIETKRSEDYGIFSKYCLQ